MCYFLYPSGGRNMNILTLLENLASNTHHCAENQALINKCSNEIKRAFTNNDITLIKKQFTKEKLNSSSLDALRVVQINK